MKQSYDIAVIGAGPGGYVAAIRAAQLGKTVALIEKERVGGTCMNRGCIPAKHLLHETRRIVDVRCNPFLTGPPLDEVGCDWPAVQKEKRRRVDLLVGGIEFLLQKNGITVVEGTGFYRNEHEIEVEQPEGRLVVKAENIILANGSRPAVLPFLKPDGERILTSREALELEDVPRRLLIIGAGAIGLEMGSIYQRLGSEVTVLEILPQILPGADLSLTRRLHKMLKGQGLDIHLRMQIEGADIRDDGVTLRGTCLKDGKAFSFTADRVLLAAGRQTETAGCEHSALQWENKGSLRVNDSWETDIPGVYAVGDLIGGKLLAHKASHEALKTVENIAGASLRSAGQRAGSDPGRTGRDGQGDRRQKGPRAGRSHPGPPCLGTDHGDDAGSGTWADPIGYHRHRACPPHALRSRHGSRAPRPRPGCPRPQSLNLPSVGLIRRLPAVLFNVT
jgi:dihydrolipoamide dehydrogenase